MESGTAENELAHSGATIGAHPGRIQRRNPISGAPAMGSENDPGIPFRLPMEKKALASLLGMRPENLSRSFAELADLGVAVVGSKVTISDMAALTELARPNPLIDSPTT
jgi:CRP/FNR family transcriptional activator FtrB